MKRGSRRRKGKLLSLSAEEHPSYSSKRTTRGGAKKTQAKRPPSSRRSASRIASKPLDSAGPVPPCPPEGSIWAQIGLHFGSVQAPVPAVRDGERGRRVRRVPCRWDGRRSELSPFLFLCLFFCGEWSNALIQVPKPKVWIFESFMCLVCHLIFFSFGKTGKLERFRSKLER